MNFERTGPWHETSDCGRYSVSAGKSLDRYVFIAWHGKEQIASDIDAEKCRQACRDHAQKEAA